LPQRLVGDAHQLAEQLVRGQADSDVVAQALAHPPHAVGPHEDRHRQGHLGRLPPGLLEVAGHQEAEELLGPAQLDVGADLDGIPALHQRVEALVQVDRLLGGKPLGEILAGRDLRQGHVPRQVEDVEERPGREPIAVVVDLGAVEVDDPPDLAEIILGVGLDLLGRQLGPRLVAPRGVADERGV